MAPAIDLRPHERDIVLAILGRHVPNARVLAFGSRITGSSKPYSDLDLVIMAPEPLSLATMAALREDFCESDLPWKVDLVEWATASEAMRASIAKDTVVLQETSPDIADNHSI